MHIEGCTAFVSGTYINMVKVTICNTYHTYSGIFSKDVLSIYAIGVDSSDKKKL